MYCPATEFGGVQFVFCLYEKLVKRECIELWFLIERDEAALNGEGNGFGAVGCAQLAHDGTDVKFGGALADDQLGCDLFVGHALREQMEDF